MLQYYCNELLFAYIVDLYKWNFLSKPRSVQAQFVDLFVKLNSSVVDAFNDFKYYLPTVQA